MEKEFKRNKISDLILFLSTLNLKLDTESLSIIDFNNNKVGKIYKNNNSLIFKAEYNDIKLEGFIENNNESNKIEFRLNDKNSNYFGKINMDDTIHSSIYYYHDNNDYINVKIQKDGNLLYIKKIDDKIKDEIVIKNNLNSIYHSITKGDYDIGRESFPYHFYAGIFDIEKDQIIKLFLREEEGKKMTDYHNSEVENTESINKSSLMMKLDSSFSEKIKDTFSFFSIDNRNFLQRLIKISYQNHSKDELLSLLGIKEEEKEKTKVKR